ncbi:ceramide glucosyltransferase [Leptotrichia sp. OH3620_COT-345]|uniref:glycosyltransferase n=1 Tax=Leptotrichia sp. OH3620_COT-345 TaxID=2491048 RepID=UPI000F648EE2|nr:glycosyltransferase [Leptotrichia sp. OH3620_COT-345]RRD39546.1 ceramide glucosyltransferase [Leptotrichia sp. OH3620_COT-345]
MLIFRSLLILTIILFILRIFFSWRYFKNIEKKEKKEINEEKYTIIQTILSGDSRLKEDLSANLKNTHKMKFMWLIDKSDLSAYETAINILQEFQKNINLENRVEIFLIDEVPQELNPKIFKISQVIEKVKTEYTIILDDDTVIDIERIKEFGIYENYENSQNEWLVTGIPYNYGTKGIWTNMISAFVNSNSFLTYFSMAYVKETRTLNGMFYMGKTDLFRKYNVFENIKYMLCDDLALAEYMLKRKVEIIQTAVFCNVRTTVKNFTSYMLLMKRWLLFSKIYMKNAFSLKFFTLVLLPSIMPFLLLITGLILGIKYNVFVFLFFAVKSSAMYIFRNKMLKKKEKSTVILYEIASDLILPVIFIYTLVTPPIIKWRNKKIRVMDGKIRYE